MKVVNRTVLPLWILGWLCVFPAFITNALSAPDATPGKTNGGAKALLGSPDFYPSPDRPVGWRGDWTGKYPGATPPVTWERRAKGISSDLRQQARKPKPGDETSARQMDLGIIAEWLLAGPFSGDNGKGNAGKELIPDIPNAQPDQDQPAGTGKWQYYARVGPNKTALPFDLMHPDAKDAVIYAHAYIHAGTAGKCRLWLSHDEGAKAWMNGNPVYSSDKRDNADTMVELKKGWNRLLIKVLRGSKDWRLQTRILPSLPIEYETKNIKWMTLMPGWTQHWAPSAPVVVGDKVFVLVYPGGDLVCLDKNNGKILWMRSNGWWDVAPDKEKNSAAFRENIKPLVERLEASSKELITAINAGVSNSGFDSERKNQLNRKLFERQKDLGQEIFHKMRLVDEKKYRVEGYFRMDPSGTPCTDGKRIYVWVPFSGVSACYDLDGNRVWVGEKADHQSPDHGLHSSPVLMKNKFVGTTSKGIWVFDCATGVTLYSLRDVGFYTACSASPIPLKLGADDAVLFSGGMKGSGGYLRIDVEKNIARQMIDKPAWEHGSSWGTAVAENGVIYAFPRSDNGPSWFSAMKLPDKFGGKGQMLHHYRMDFADVHRGVLRDWSKLGWHEEHISSPLCVDGLIYGVTEGACLTVTDAGTGKKLYDRSLNVHSIQGYVTIPGVCSSPTLAGKYIYIVGDQGITVVMEPGRDYREVSRNVIETFGHEERVVQEQFMANPVFDGRKIFIRGQEYLYCIEDEKNGGVVSVSPVLPMKRILK